MNTNFLSYMIATKAFSGNKEFTNVSVTKVEKEEDPKEVEVAPSVEPEEETHEETPAEALEEVEAVEVKATSGKKTVTEE